MDLDITDKREQRKFGVVMAVAIVVVGGIRYLIAGHFSIWFVYVAIPFLVLGIVAPKALQPIFWAWMRLALILNFIITTLILTLAFFLIMVPTRLILALVGKDPLNRKFDPNAETYWEDAEDQPEELEAYYNRF